MSLIKVLIARDSWSTFGGAQYHLMTCRPEDTAQIALLSGWRIVPRDPRPADYILEANHLGIWRHDAAPIDASRET